jgi:electron transport complex protein RnfG
LGDKIEKDGRFTENVSTLDVRLDDERRVPLHDIELVKRGEKTDGWQVEAITGATISSRAVANILRESVRDVLPALQANLEEIGGVTQ